MTINQRIKKLRKACKKTQFEFASVLGLSRTAYTEIESERRRVLDRHLTMLSNWKEYNVNIDWLKTGDGEMFLNTETDALQRLKKEYGLNDSQFAFIADFIHLPEDEKDIILDFMKKVASHQTSADPDPDDIETKVDAYREQLEKEKEEAGKSSALYG